MHGHEDAAITEAILQGDVERYSELLEKYQDSVYAIVARRVPADAVAAVAQDVFVRAYQSLPGYSATAPFGNWMSRIAIRSCCAYWREQMRHRARLVSISPTSVSGLNRPPPAKPRMRPTTWSNMRKRLEYWNGCSLNCRRKTGP